VSWSTSTIPNPSFPYTDMFAVSVKDMIIIGGSAGTQIEFKTYNATSGIWGTIFNPVLGWSATNTGSARVSNGALFVLPGSGAEYYSTAMNMWSGFTNLSVPRFYPNVGATANVGVISGGQNNSGSPFTAVDNVDIYIPATQTWVASNLQTPRTGHTSTQVGNWLIIAGGMDASNNLLSSMEIVSTCLNHGDCDDGIFCNGMEICNFTLGICQYSQNPCGGGACTQCNEAAASCISATGTLCDDGIWCNGLDYCNGFGNCSIHLGNPCINGTQCRNTCNEYNQSCISPYLTKCLFNFTKDGVCDGVNGTCNLATTIDTVEQYVNLAKGLSGGAIAGIFFLVFFTVIGIIILAACIRRRRARRLMQQQQATEKKRPFTTFEATGPSQGRTVQLDD